MLDNKSNTTSDPARAGSSRHPLVEELLRQDFILLDGAMGTQLQEAGLKLGERPEILCITDPDIVAGVHHRYIQNGSRIIYANTFGANAHKLEGTGYSAREVITAAIHVAKEAAAAASCLVALDVGPIGEMLEPYGTLSFESAYELYKEMILAGASAGADLIVFETMTDLYEVRAAVLAAKENCSLPVFVTMTFEQSGRTFTGTCVESMALVLEGLGADAIGINCSLGPDEIYPIAKRLADSTDLPLIIKANAGLPDPETGAYDIDALSFAESMTRYIPLGLRFVGGCCGTSPDFIAALRSALAGRTAAVRQPVVRPSRVCTPTQVITIDQVRVIGERINPTGKKRFRQALMENDMDYILEQGIQQMEAGADILDVNVGLPDIDETAMMVRVIKELQAVVDIPLQLDSTSDEAIERGLRVCNGKPIVNSVNGDPEIMAARFPLVKKYGAAVLGLTLDSSGLPSTAQERFDIACRIVDTAYSYGIKREDIFIDCLTLTVSAQQLEAMETLKALTMVRQQLGVHTVLGVSNISFGLPYRELINQSFLMMAMTCGLDLPIINPNSEPMMHAVMAYHVLSGADRDSTKYIEHFADYTPPAAGTPSGSSTPSGKSNRAGEEQESIPEEAAELFHAIDTGMKEGAVKAVEKLLETNNEMDVINNYLIPALDRVGIRFEKQIIFLPQLLNSAAAASEGFELIKKRLAGSGGTASSRGTIILATVQGDIHDIGKNIVKIILENYGFTVLDLGRDVAPETVVETAVRENIRLVGLSALMTTTLPSMEATIRLLKASGHDCVTMVGGAVLTPEYAEKMGADYYAADAKASADIAKLVFG